MSTAAILQRRLRVRDAPVTMAGAADLHDTKERADLQKVQTLRTLQSGSSADIYGIPREEWLQLKGPVRYMGNEFGAMHKSFDEQQVRITMTYPETYEVGMSNTAIPALQYILNQESSVMCDRAYFPDADAVAMLARHNKPLFAVESRRPLCDFDALGFSLAYELGGINVLEMLRLGDVPVSSEERMQAESSAIWNPDHGSPPLVFAGGPTATSNPEPFSDFLDFVALGDGEDLLPEIARCLRAAKASRLSRLDTLRSLAATVAGVYVPQLYAVGAGGAVAPTDAVAPPRVLRRVATPLVEAQVGLVPFVETIHDRMTIEIRRGCTRGCRFCQPGMLTRPARDVDPDTVVDTVEQGIRTTGYHEFSLLSLSCSDYLALPSVGLQIKNRLRGENVNLSLPSQRVDRFDEDIGNIVSSGKKSSLTFAPEAGTQRLRDIVNKGLTSEELLRGIRSAWEQGWRRVKLYFMIGLPGELDEDVLGIAETIGWLQQHCHGKKGPLEVHVTISNFTPKPHTPFQWHSVSTAEFERKQDMLRDALHALPAVKVLFTDVRLSAMEDFIARGDRSLGRVLRRAWELGATNDMWWLDTTSCYRAWNQAIEEAGLSWKYRQVLGGEWNSLEMLGDARFRKQGGRGKGRIDRGEHADGRLDAPLPWDHIDTGINKSWLKTDLQRALEAATVPDCSHSGLCSKCGVCGDDFGENVVAMPPPIPAFEGHYTPDTSRALRVRLTMHKFGDMVFVGHLDLLRMLERACRRAALPMSSDESPHNPRVRLSYGPSLPVGATSSCEALELMLTEQMDVEAVQAALQAQVPHGLTVVSARSIKPYRLDGSLAEGLGTLVQNVTYQLVLEQTAGDGGRMVELQRAVDAVRAADTYLVTKKTKRKQRKKQVDLKAGVMKMQVVQKVFDCDVAALAPEAVSRVALRNLEPHSWGVVEFTVATAQDGGHLKPELFVNMLSDLSGASFHLSHVHRSGTAIGEVSPAALKQHDLIHLSKMARAESMWALQRHFGKGPLAGDLATRPVTVQLPLYSGNSA
eukprot:jgi/Ulvmu1/4548/UM002_0274.1